jgi:hypothetical protein
MPQHDGAARIVANDVERVLADIDADYGDRGIGSLRHGVLLVFGAPCQLCLLAGQEHGRTIPLAEASRTMAEFANDVREVSSREATTGECMGQGSLYYERRVHVQLVCMVVRILKKDHNHLRPGGCGARTDFQRPILIIIGGLNSRKRLKRLKQSPRELGFG